MEALEAAMKATKRPQLDGQTAMKAGFPTMTYLRTREGWVA